MRSDRRRWYSVRCSGVPFLKCTIWPFPLPTSVLLPIFIRGQALRIQIRSRALCPSHFKTTLCIAPIFSVNIFMREVLCPKTKELTFCRMFACMCVCVWPHSQNHFLLAFVYNSLFFWMSPCSVHTNGKASIRCFGSVLLSHLWEILRSSLLL